MVNNSYKEGDAVLRIKTDLKHPDPSIRDWWMAKVVDSPQHPRVDSSQHIWPSYNLASAIDDHEMGITLILRGQEHEQNQTKQEFLYKYLGWNYPHSFHFGRIKLEDMVLSTSKIKEGIERKEYTGWDDPRLGTIRALRRRGFQAEALRKAVLDVGVKSSDAQIDGKRLADLNKEAVGDAPRIAFFQDPLQLDVDYAQATEVEMNNEKIEWKEGTQKFLVDKKAVEKFKVGDVFRLREAYNVKITKKDSLQLFGQFVGTAKTGKPMLQWMLQGRDVEILMPDNSKVAGIAAETLAGQREGQIVYLNQFGYCRVEENNKKTVLVFAHK